jgi:hypothetical protein
VPAVKRRRLNLGGNAAERACAMLWNARSSGPMRALLVASLLALAGCTYAAGGACSYGINMFPCSGFTDRTRIESFAPGPNGTFTFSARTNTVMTENEDGSAERIRREWLAEALSANAMCQNGYVVDRRQIVPRPHQGPFSNTNDIVYAGRCLQ